MAVPACVNCQVMRHCAEPIGKTEGSVGLTASRTGDSEVSILVSLIPIAMGFITNMAPWMLVSAGRITLVITLVDTPSNPWCERSNRYYLDCVSFALVCTDRNFHMN